MGEVVLVYESIRPYTAEERLLVDDRAGVLNQDQERFDYFGRQWNNLPFAEE